MECATYFQVTLYTDNLPRAFANGGLAFRLADTCCRRVLGCLSRGLLSPLYPLLHESLLACLAGFQLVIRPPVIPRVTN